MHPTARPRSQETNDERDKLGDRRQLEIMPMKILVGTVLASLILLVTTGQAQQQAALITNIAGRHTIDLNGRWQIIIDPYETGYYDYRYQPSTDGYFKNAKPKSPSDLIEYDFDTSEQINVPAIGTRKINDCSSMRVRSGTRNRS